MAGHKSVVIEAALESAGRENAVRESSACERAECERAAQYKLINLKIVTQFCKIFVYLKIVIHFQESHGWANVR